MATIKKALRNSIRRRRYSMFEKKENDYIHTPTSKRSASEEPENNTESETWQTRFGASTNRRHSAILRRGSKMTRSMKDAVGNLTQKLRTSTRRLRPLKENQTSTPVRSSARKGGRDVDMYSPFRIDTPGRATGRVARRSNIRTVASLETPTRLRREVEALTSNMQALATLTPNTLTNRVNRKSPPLTNGSLKTPRSARRKLVTTTTTP